MRIKLIAVLSTFFLSLTLNTTVAATKSPTPTPKATVSAKASASAKATATPKAPVKKAPVKKKKKKKVVTLSPSPSPKWPPVGFKTDALGETKLYLKVPSAKELVGIISAKSALASQVKACTQFTCGAVQVASETGCRWWRVNAEVIGATSAENRSPKTFGKIISDVTRSEAKQIVTILLVTTEPIGAGHIVSNINVDCNQGDPTGPLPNTDYQVIADK